MKSTDLAGFGLCIAAGMWFLVAAAPLGGSASASLSTDQALALAVAQLSEAELPDHGGDVQCSDASFEGDALWVITCSYTVLNVWTGTPSPPVCRRAPETTRRVFVPGHTSGIWITPEPGEWGIACTYPTATTHTSLSAHSLVVTLDDDSGKVLSR